MESVSKMVPDNIPLSDIQDAKCRMEGQIMKTPLVPLNYDVKHGKVSDVFILKVNSLGTLLIGYITTLTICIPFITIIENCRFR